MTPSNAQYRLRAVIELPVKTAKPPAASRAGQLTRDIATSSPQANYTSTPDGWFVPIHDLLPRIEDVADFLQFDALETGSLEICGGLEIRERERALLNVPLDSNFRFALDFAAAILTLRKQKRQQRVSVSSDHVLELSLEDDGVVIKSGQPSSFLAHPIRFPCAELFDQTEIAIKEITSFAQRLQYEWDNHKPPPLEEGYLDWLFGLDKHVVE